VTRKVGHDKNIKAIEWVSWIDKADQLITSGTLEDGTNETIMWDTKG